ncbi:carboxylating nicotinate-nucleotide diphosphorylase [Wenzhouxiangella limi]|uniref:Probable nicotinate-nucleotide pyrophosphorylase [carboxylating] n=1 Tax=Wenzhouxiangella limi TaxID=2707351 RepID=A0A845V1W0_9GAMM|nr:carboxylating nicotinate-nucleotide diphosphorylase [Wenzhouxiangella limi]NDY96582.1 carboxylating nicotinate-nucleotide diphosphorylase [Wenzhouxiangella limi]
MNIADPALRRIVALALAEDLGGRGDVTGQATIPDHVRARFELRARSPGVLAGRAAAAATLAQVDSRIEARWHLDDGARLAAGTPIASLSGPARAILTAERTALNFLGRLSGIATLTRAFVDAVAGTSARIAHTRKTSPGLRALELAAVAAGGGAAHRFGLDDAVLIKDNHVAVCGGVAAALERARQSAGHMTRISVEIDHLGQLDEALDGGAEVILLDNFSLSDLGAAVARTTGLSVILEASGGVALDSVRAIAETGVDIISVGAITHSAPSLDLGLDAQ